MAENASPPQKPKAKLRTGRWAVLVALGILLSRVAGLVRDRVFAHYFGNSDAADAFKAAFRIPNFLQNLFGDGVLSASFIPVYAGLLARGEQKQANRLAGAILALLSLLISALVLFGVLTTPLFIDLVAPGFEGAKRELTIALVRILFPGAGLLVISAWCLGILNSHHKFFLSYAAPVVWNLVMIGALLGYGGSSSQTSLAQTLAWASVIGSAFQVAVQFPTVRLLIKRLPLSLGRGQETVRTVIRNAIPVFISRGVVQISAYIDSLLASLLPTGAVSALAYAQTLYLLPISLFGMSISAVELPVMSSAVGAEDQVHAELRGRLDSGLRRIGFFVVPSAAGYLVLGDVIVGAIYQTGRFTRADTAYVWVILAGSTVGLLATTLGRLYSSTFYALKDTRTPLRFALLRVGLTTVLGYVAALTIPPLLGLEARWGAVGLTGSAGLVGWVEFGLLRRALNRRIGKTGLRGGLLFKLWSAALLAAGTGFLVKRLLDNAGPVPTAIIVLGVYGLLYWLLTVGFGIAEAEMITQKVLRRFAKRR